MAGSFAASRAERRLLASCAGLLLAGLVGGVAAPRLSASFEYPEVRAARLARHGELRAAELAYLEAARRLDPPDLDVVMELLDLHRRLAPPSAPPGTSFGSAVTEDLLDGLVARAARAPEERTLARFARGAGDDALRAEVEALADREPPPPWANRLLGRRALEARDLGAAALRLDREGSFHSGHRGDVTVALDLWADAEDWEEAARRAADPRYDGLVPANLRLRLAIRERSLAGAARAFLPSWYGRLASPAAVLAALGGAAWCCFGLHLGRARDAPRRRVPLYLLAFGLGIASTLPTGALVLVQDELFGFEETGDLGMDAAYYVFGVGLREELCKLLLFLPLLPLLGRRAHRIEMLACGAMVGLGFASAENVAYFQLPSVSVALTRFLTANVAHLSWTGLLALSVDDLRRRRGKPEDLSATLALVVGLHGAYDLLLSSPLLGEISWLSMTVFVVLLRRFLGDVAPVRHGASGPPLLHVFIACLAAVTAAGFVYGSLQVGPAIAAWGMGLGILGEALLIYMFVLEMGRV